MFNKIALNIKKKHPKKQRKEYKSLQNLIIKNSILTYQKPSKQKKMAPEDKHPISEHATSKKNPILEMNQRINEKNNR